MTDAATQDPKDEADPAQDIAGADATQLAGMVATATDEQLAEGMASEGRKAILDEIFRRMGEHMDPAKAEGVDAVVHFQISGRADGSSDTYEAVIRNGECTTTDAPTEQPRVTLKIGGVDFLRLVTGQAAGPQLFMSGKLQIDGDMMFAATVSNFFRVPGADGSASAA